MPIKVTCGGCGSTLSTPDSSAGKRAKCPKCEAIIQIPVPPAADDPLDALSSPFDDLTEEEMTAGEVKQDERKPCPACGEMIVRGAVKCRFCGEIFDPALKQQEQKKKKKKRKRKRQTTHYDDDDLTAGDWVVSILCSGIGCILGLIYMVQGKSKGWKMVLISLAVQGFWLIVRILLEGVNQDM